MVFLLFALSLRLATAVGACSRDLVDVDQEVSLLFLEVLILEAKVSCSALTRKNCVNRTNEKGAT